MIIRNHATSQFNYGYLANGYLWIPALREADWIFIDIGSKSKVKSCV